MQNTTYELDPLLAEIRDGFRGMRAIRASLRATKREDRRAARCTHLPGARPGELHLARRPERPGRDPRSP